MKLSIVIVSYNVKDYLRQCLRSIYRSDLNDDSFEVIIIDNDSHDGTVEDLSKDFKEVKFKKNNKNYGFSKAVNMGINMAKGKFICILNPDIIIQENTFSSLIKFYEEKDNIGCVGPKILNSDGSIQHSCKRSFPTPLNAISRLLGLDKLFPKSKIFGKYNLTYLDINKIHKVDSISGAFMLFHKKIINKIGLFDEDFFMFGEDIDFCHRIKDSGYDNYYNPKTEIIHYKGESVKNAPYDMVNVFYSAMHIYFDKYSDRYNYWYLINVFVKFGLWIRRFFSYLKLVLTNMLSLFFDTVSIALSFSLSIYFWYNFQHEQSVNYLKILSHWQLALNFILCWYIASKLTRAYKDNFSVTRFFLSILITFLISSTSTYFISFFAYSRGVLLISTLITFFLLIGWRFLIIKIFPLKVFSGFVDRRALIIGSDKKSFEIGEEIRKNPENRINIIGYTDRSNPLFINNFLGKLEYIKGIVKKNKITEIIIRENYIQSKEIFKIIKSLNDLKLTFKIIPMENNIILGKGEIEQISGIDLMSYEVPFLERGNILIKRFFDIFVSLLLIIITFPIYLIYFLFNKIYTQKMWGLDGEEIELKFISSKKNFISSIPLLYHILYGDISFVGSQIVSIQNKNPYNILKPGLISLINIKKYKDNDSQRINDYYIRNQSLTFDIEIILKSLFRI